MTNTYRPLSVSAKSAHGEGVVELDLSVMDEKDALDGGHLEIAPRKYRVLSDNYAADAQGAVVELALLKENDAALIQGGHLERVGAVVVGEARDEMFIPTEPGTVVPAPKKKED